MYSNFHLSVDREILLFIEILAIVIKLNKVLIEIGQPLGVVYFMFMIYLDI